MTQAQQPEALRLAGICETKGMFPVADELNRMHARILELEQGKCLYQIAEPAAPHAARDLGLAALEQYLKECEENQIVADVGGAFAYAWQRAAAPQAVQPVVPLPLLVRDIARDLGITVPEACIALKPLGNYSTNSAVTAEMARMLRDHFPARARAAEPMFWVRLCRDGLYEGPVHNNSASGKLQRDAKPEEWHPLYLHTAPAHPAEGVPEQSVDGNELIRAAKQALAATQPAAGAVASIYVTAGGEREFDDWRVPLSVGQNLLYTHPAQPAAQGMEHQKPSFYAAFGGSGAALPQYSAHTEEGVIYNVLAVARNEGFKGSGLDRLMELGWVVRPVFRGAALAAQAKKGGADHG